MSHKICGSFLACMDRFCREKEPQLDLTFFCYSFDFVVAFFKDLMPLIQKHIFVMDLQMWTAVLGGFLFHSWRTAGKV